MSYLIIPPIIFWLLFLIIYLKEPRTLWLGTSLIAAAGVSMLCLLISIFAFKNPDLTEEQLFLAGIAAAILAFILMIIPLALILLFIVNGIRLLKREGFSMRNLLWLAMGVGMLSYPFVTGLLQRSFEYFRFSEIPYEMVALMITYLFILASIYTLSSLLNTFYLKPDHPDYIVVLGSGLNGDQVTPLLASRIKKGIAIYQKNPGSQLIMSGGKGEDELIAEGEAMYQYAIAQGVPEEAILVENQSRNTRENILFSKKLMTKSQHFCLVTNYYHLFRALLHAKALKSPCRGYGAKTKLYFTLNAFIREFVGYLYLKRKLHTIVLLILLGIFTILRLIVFITSGQL
ncbi:YdcF family protein [Streptococcus ictaluri]|uniref:Membrane protein n=1 Tax=Streptococcus ictaluri 707-05 TaxID=764299 RepID=G5JZE8_9STRE|nr:YdcF family protein [Streptococcus ictaluri]EHI71003.1 putative membrane protein [Streptococcus ictaluri 707-05]